MSEIKPVNIDRINDDLMLLIACLNDLGGVNWGNLTEADLEPFVRDKIERNREMYRRSPQLVERFSLETNSTDVFRSYFDAAWEDLNVSLRRLKIQLNDGDIDMLDCNINLREHLKNLWDMLEQGFATTKKPTFVEQGKQEWYHVAKVFGELLQDRILLKPSLASCEYFYSHLKRMTALGRTALGRYIEIAGLTKTGRGVRDRKFSREEVASILKAVIADCPISAKREAAEAALEELPP